MFQLQNYNIDQQLIWFKKNYKDYILNFLLFAIYILDLLFKKNIFNILLYFVLFILFILNLPKQQKKQIVWTNRIKRLLALNFIIFLIPIILFILNIRISYSFSILFLCFLPMIVFFTMLLLKPVEDNIKYKYILLAKQKLDSFDSLYVIGITGSFGKTSSKNFLYNLLKEKYNICSTPESFNTPMGNTITINNNLKNYDDIYISEMGARRIGDIKEICDIVKPDSCILTDVGEQHLDTFKNIENVLNTKFEIVDSVIKKIDNNHNNQQFGNYIFYNGDNKYINNKIKQYDSRYKQYFYSFGLGENNAYYAKNIRISEDGMTFDFYYKLDNEYLHKKFNTKLLGVHNILNLVATIGLSLKLNVNIDDIFKYVQNIKPVKHRLEFIKLSDKYIIIDDAYNSNIKGFKYSVDVLKNFDDSWTKIIITPGVVELGDKQYVSNYELSKYASEIVDYAFVVGNANKKPLMDGFKINLKNKNLKYFDKFNDANNEIRNIISEKKVILIENDLTDNY